MNKYNITLGSDPEVFVENDKGEVVSAIGMIPGTKKSPHPISDDGHFIQIDNVAMEFNIPPSLTEDEFVNNIQHVLDYLEEVASIHNTTLSNKSSYSLNSEELKHPIAQVFGCEPDFNVYLRDINNPPKSEDPNLRSVGGHVHIGYPNPDFQTTEKIVKAFDMFVALPAMLIDTDTRRRELYGKAGSFRVKDPWGLECRVLSNFWIHSDELIRWVYRNTIKSVNLVLDGKYDECFTEFEEQVRDIIDNNKVEEVKPLVEKLDKLINKITV